MPSAVVTGYYRFSDIFFEWHQVIPNQEEISPLKALLAYDSLVHRDHPLRKEGIDGIELFMGTLHNAETRLMFSSAQVEYIRYWLHAMKLTKSPIPIPSAESLLTESSLRNVSPVVYNDAASLKKALKIIEKNNKRLKFIDDVLVGRRHMFERVRTFWSEKSSAWCAMDFESWEKDHTVLTEFGWTIHHWENGSPIVEDGHLVIEEHRSYYNGTFVPDHRENFLFGETHRVNKKGFKDIVCGIIEKWSTKQPLFLVFHDRNQDIKYLKSSDVGAQLDGLNYELPDVLPDEGLFVVDTADLFSALEGDSAGSRRSLERVCLLLGIPVRFLHNAGNDAHYTLEALKAMASGDPVDLQRDKRWPNSTAKTNGIKVEFKPWEETDDYDEDLEALMPPLKDVDLGPANETPVNDAT
ncbi:hypothetical protein JAAARDRAFT_28209 [Jaapia argillacea MUCL 33604]|uniref:Gfd2/YDR514C-like C-terminal domain-containing protein n=1 Tax=Jaapia argillacea MUCL 33604 TaxID=933084 RepID=A0A067QC92_9AGAM|nr:hypothetical protein JAAARDRAFT_28209 [Jaapia argillacea MUCL 33604]